MSAIFYNIIFLKIVEDLIDNIMKINQMKFGTRSLAIKTGIISLCLKL